MSTIEIDTTQNVGIRFHVANVIERILARVIDGTIQASFLYACLVPLGAFGFIEADDMWIGITIATIGGGIVFFYSFLMESIFHGQTIGKMAMNIRVVRTDGTEPNVGNYAIRFFVSVFEVSMTFGVVATVAVIASKSSQRLGDMAAGTLVVRKPRRVTLAQVGMLAEQPDRVIRYHGAANLSASDSAVLQEVLLEAKRRYLNADAVQSLVESTKARIESVIGETADRQQSDVMFLRTVLDDYNAIHGRTADATSGTLRQG